MTRDEREAWIDETVEDRMGAYATHLSAARAREYAKGIARDAMAVADAEWARSTGVDAPDKVAVTLHTDAHPMATRAGGEMYPMATGNDSKGGWTIDPTYLDKIACQVRTEDEQASMEIVEAILLAALRTTPAPPASGKEKP